MGKKRKTFKEKLISDLRRRGNILEGVRTTSLPLPTPQEIVLQVPTPKLIQNQYPYLLKDISKTGILTASVIAIQILLFILLKNHILMLPGVTY
jgi:hypothetical protein